MNEYFQKLDTTNKESYILADFNINLYLNNKYVFGKCNFFSLKQLTSCPAGISCSSSTNMDHILTSYPDRVSQEGILNFGISDHQVIFLTRKTLETNTGSHNQISFHSLKIAPLKHMRKH